MARPKDDATDDVQPPTDAGDDVAAQPEPGDTVLLTEKPAGGLMCAPNRVEGRLSGSGKTIIVEADEDGHRPRRQLDAATIFEGGMESRRSTWYTLYSVEGFQQRQRSNRAPGPQAGANKVSDAEDLPAPTHAEVDNYTPAAED